MKTLVAGATGQCLVRQLLERGHDVTIIVRTTEKLPETIRTHNNISIITAPILDISDEDMAKHVNACDAVVSCLGHMLSLRGVYGSPRRLVTESVSRLCQAVQTNKPTKPVKFVLMNSAGCRNLDMPEIISFGQHCVIGLLRLLLPPHVDNEKAAEYLRTTIGQNHPTIQWAVVRPDNLVDDNAVSPYKVYESPIRSAIFDAGTTSRVNVAQFITDLITDPSIWSQWKGKMPVIYNQLPQNS